MINAIPFSNYFRTQFEIMGGYQTVELHQMADIQKSIKQNFPTIDTSVITYRNVSTIQDIVSGYNRIDVTVTGKAKNAPHHLIKVRLKKEW